MVGAVVFNPGAMLRPDLASGRWAGREVKTVRGASSLDRLEASAMRTSCFDPMLMRQARIGRSLREVYDGVADSPMPDQFDALLSELDKIAVPERR